MIRSFNHSLPLKILKKNFATSHIKLNTTKATNTFPNSQIEYQNFYFKHQTMEYKAQIPKRPSQTILEFLDMFSKERSTTTKQYTSRDFELCRGEKYLKLSQTLNEIETSPNDKEPVVLLDSTLNISNISYRGLKHLSNPYQDSSQALQTFLNSFLDKINVPLDKVNKESIISKLSSFTSLDGNKSKTESVIVAIISQLEQIFPEKNIKLEFKLNYNIDMKEFNKNNIVDAFIIKNVNNDVEIPVNVLSPVNDESERIKKFDIEIINNMDLLRKLAEKNKTILNFGIITDLHNWKINLYHKPKDEFLEKSSDFLTSLKYSLSASSADISTHSLAIILRVLAGILTVDQKQVKKISK